jgi:tRNA uridine 5-carboxymethylaminomethyl modification enzyme
MATPAFAAVFGRLPTDQGVSAFELLRRPEASYAAYRDLGLAPAELDETIAEQVEIAAKYAGYIDRQQAEIERTRRHEETRIPVGFDYAAVKGLSNEVRAKLISHRPDTVGQAGRISGVTPAALSLLLVYLRRIGDPHRGAAA